MRLHDRTHETNPGSSAALLLTMDFYRHCVRQKGAVLLLFVAWVCSGACAVAQNAVPQGAETPNTNKELELQQKQVATQYSKLEEMFLRMSELEAASNPTRAGLLMQAAQLSKQLATQQRMVQASDLLGKGQFSRAIPELESSRENLKKLLELLQSENRSTRIKDERKRLEDVLKDIRRVENIQRATRGRTEAGQNREDAANDQRDLEKQLGQSEEDLKSGDEPKDSSTDSSNENKSKPSSESDPSSKSEGSDNNQDPSENSEKKTGDGKSKDPPKSSPDGARSKNSEDPTSEGQNSEGKKNEGENQGNPSEGKSGDPKEGENGEKDPKNESNPSDQDASASKEDPSKNDNPDNKNAEDTKGQSGQDPNSSEKNKQSDPNGKPSDPSEQDASKKPSSKPSSEQDSQSGDKPSSDEPSSDDAEMESDDSESDASADGKPQSKEEQARKRVQRARQRMKRAEQKLRNDQRKDAVQEQQKAEEELQRAIAELERILTQLREEEIDRALVDLETRLKRMSDWEKTIRDQTEKLSALTGEDRDRQLEIQANRLSIEQLKVVMEGQRAMMLLKDEGSSQAFPEALEQVMSDSQIVVKRLAAADVSVSTRSIEDEILGSLEEMIESLKQVQKKREEEKQQQQNGGQPSGGSPQDQPLVDKLSELRLIKALQLRVNRRTNRLANESESSSDWIGQVGESRFREELIELSVRQQKIQEVTREILLEQAKK